MPSEDELMAAVKALADLQALSVHLYKLEISWLDQLGDIDHTMIEFLPGDLRDLADRLHTLFT